MFDNRLIEESNALDLHRWPLVLPTIISPITAINDLRRLRFESGEMPACVRRGNRNIEMESMLNRGLLLKAIFAD